jgi:hypothetical protein
MSKAVKAKKVVRMPKAASGKETRRSRGGRASVRGNESSDGIEIALWQEEEVET